MRANSLTIVYVLPSVEISGGTYVAWEHAMRLRKRGHDVMFAVPHDAAPPLSWLPHGAIPLITLRDIPANVDALIATWWETAYLIAPLPAKAKFYLIQSVESRFYSPGQKVESFFSALSYTFNYHVITVSRWLAEFLKCQYHRDVCRVQNQLNTDLFRPVDPASRQLPAGWGCQAFLSLRVRSASPTEAQLFWDTGDGFSEEQSLMFEIADDWVDKVIAMDDLPRIRRIRIDPGSVADNTVEFFSISLAVAGGPEIDLLASAYWKENRHVRKLSREGNILRVASCGNDPCIVTSLGRAISSPSHARVRDEGTSGVRILVEGPLGIEFKGVERALQIARQTGCAVWLVEGKAPHAMGTGFLGHRVFTRVPIDKMRYIYSNCDILLKLSRVESFAYPPLEMMACGGIPVVGDVEGIREYMVDGYNGFIVDPDNEEQIRSVLSRLIEDRGLRERISSGCRDTVAAHSDWEGQIDILENFLREKVTTRTGAPEDHGTTSLPTRELIDVYLSIMKGRERSHAPEGMSHEQSQGGGQKHRYVPSLWAGLKSHIPFLDRISRQ